MLTSLIYHKIYFLFYRKQSHPKITPEIRRELLAATCRDVEMMECDNKPAAVPMEMYTDQDVGYE